jgi:hypothetical protein
LITEKRKMMMVSKDDNKCKYVANNPKEEAEEVPSKKQKTITDDGNDNGDDGDDSGDDDYSLTDDYSSEPEEEVSSVEEEMNLQTSSEEELLIREGRSDCGDKSDDEEETDFVFDDD